MTEQAEKRHLQDTLSIAGTAFIAFGVWSIAKIGLFFALSNERAVRELLGMDIASRGDVNTTTLTIIVYVTLGIIAIIDLSVRAFVGLSARSEARGKKKSPLYLVVALIVAIANAFSLVTLAMSSASTLSIFDAIIPVIIEGTAIVSLVLVIYCSIRLRRMSKATE